MGTGIFSADLSDRLDALVQDAITTAAVTGSIGASASIQNDGVADTVRVERVTLHAAGWRVAHVTIADVPEYDHSLIDMVLVRKGTPTQYSSHELSELEQAIKDEFEADEYDQQHETYNPDEDYQRSLIHDLDI